MEDGAVVAWRFGVHVHDVLVRWKGWHFHPNPIDTGISASHRSYMYVIIDLVFEAKGNSTVKTSGIPWTYAQEEA
jgi:hypothetical protein